MSKRSMQRCAAGLVVFCALQGAAWAGLGRPGEFEVSAQGLNIKANLFGRMIPTSALDVGAARVVDPDAEPGPRARFKLIGVGLPHYQAGWFRLFA